MKKLIYVFALVLLSMASCKKQEEVQQFIINDSLFQIITVSPDDINKKDRSKISEFAEGIEYIPLQTSDSILIGEIKKIIVWDNQYYIWDNLSETIFCFSSDGKFRYKIYKQGEAPDEYLRISDFTLDRDNGNVIIYSDMNQTFYEYTQTTELVRKTKASFLLSSFATQSNRMHCYIGKLPNMDFYKEIFPESYRYVTLKNGKLQNQQLKYKYNESFLRIPLSTNNFTFYGDTILLTEFLAPEVYWIDSLGNLNPRYRIKFTTNKYIPTFNEDIDLEEMKQKIKQGELTLLYNGFYETKKYLFFNFSRGLIGMAYVNKEDGSIHNLGYFLLDDFNQNTLPASINFMDEEYMYKIVEPGQLMAKNEKSTYSSYLKNICNNMSALDNPVMIRIKLK